MTSLTRSALTKIDAETLKILNDKGYQNILGSYVDLSDLLKHAVSDTKIYYPGDLPKIDAQGTLQKVPFSIEITEETTSAAGKRLVKDLDRVAVLNFASAKNPGGGFLNGARAQEEDLTRKSGLYACLNSQRDYYNANKKCKSFLYTDHLIYSPDVPFIRDENLNLLTEPYLLSVITSPAPNAGEELQKNPKSKDKIKQVLENRAKDVLLTAKINNHRKLVLGAWGCGIFRNDPKMVAEIFLKHFKNQFFANCFDHVVFAIYEFSYEKTLLKAFKEVIYNQ